jgi:transcriptional regulator with XRE-family HTH domain
MLRSGLTRAQLSAELGVSVRTLDKWLLPDTSSDFRRMPETALRLLAAQHGVRKSDGLSMPYDWSNPGMPDETLFCAEPAFLISYASARISAWRSSVREWRPR